MEIADCRKRKKIYKRLIAGNFDNFLRNHSVKDDEIEAIMLAIRRSIAIEELNLANLKKEVSE